MNDTTEGKIVSGLFGAIGFACFALATQYLTPTPGISASICLGEARRTSIEHLARAEELAARKL